MARQRQGRRAIADRERGALRPPYGRKVIGFANFRDGWWATGDLVQHVGVRILFLGRRSETINVGGAKVNPAEVEACISEVLGVRWVRVTSRKSSIAGNLVIAEVVADGSSDRETLRQAITVNCFAKLPRYSVPRMIEFVESLGISASGKACRG